MKSKPASQLRSNYIALAMAIILGFGSTSNAAFTINVTTFTTTEFTFTLSGSGTLTGSTPFTNRDSLFLAVPGDNDWLVSPYNGGNLSGDLTIGGTSVAGAQPVALKSSVYDVGADAIYLRGPTIYYTGQTIAGSNSISFSGDFSPSNLDVSQLKVFWGTPAIAPTSLPALSQETVVVPEPSIYSFCASSVALLLVFSRHKRPYKTQ